MEALVKQLGFESEKEFHHLVASVDLSTPEKTAAFKKWQDEDGSKGGLLKLSAPKHHPSCPGGKDGQPCLCGLYDTRDRLIDFVRFVEKAHSGHSLEHGCTTGICKEIDKLKNDFVLRK